MRDPGNEVACVHSFYFFLSDRPTFTHLHEREGDGKRNILLGWPKLKEKALHALFSLRKRIEFSTQRSRQFLWSMGCICKIWSQVLGQLGQTEKARLQFCKYYLEVSKKVSNVAELGKFPLIKVLKSVTPHIFKKGLLPHCYTNLSHVERSSSRW